jgi:uncharacterized protein (DUF1015 family)
VLKIADIRTDTRIEFVGGARGVALGQLVDPATLPSRFRFISQSRI